MNCPCANCCRVPDPRQCEDKNCRLWRRWFVEKWDHLRMTTRLEKERQECQPEGECIGGVYYALPHRIDSYLNTDPCESCQCPRDLCVIPCRMKRNWLSARENVLN